MTGYPEARPTGLKLVRDIFQFYRDPMQMLTTAADTYGDVVLFKIGSIAMYQFRHPDHVQHILQDHGDRYRMSGVFEDTGKGGLPTIEGDYWQKHRRIMQPAFQPQHLHYSAPVIVQCVDEAVAQWPTGTPINIAQELLFVHQRVIGQVLLGVDFATPNHPILLALGEMRAFMARRVHAMFTLPESLPLPRNRRYQQAAAEVGNFVRQLITTAQTTPDAVPHSMLTGLLHARDERSGDSLNTDELYDELMAVFFAAYEDPANALAWALYELSQHPAVEEQLRAEVVSVLGDAPPTFEDANRLPYTRMVIDEILRLYPPTWSIMRDAKVEDTVGGYTVPEYTMVMLNAYLTHRMPEFWPNPDRFDPERFRGDALKALPKYAYYPFGGGGRRCIGASFALAEMTIGLARLVQLRRFKLLPQSEVRIEVHNSLQPAHTIWMQAD